jgi:hypothetical protein
MAQQERFEELIGSLYLTDMLSCWVDVLIKVAATGYRSRIRDGYGPLAKAKRPITELISRSFLYKYSQFLIIEGNKSREKMWYVETRTGLAKEPSNVKKLSQFGLLTTAPEFLCTRLKTSPVFKRAVICGG